MKSLIDISQEIYDRLSKYCKHVYFQPPNNLKIEYPCIIYKRSRIENIHGNNNVYNQNHPFEIIVIDTDPDSKITENISRLSKCRFDRRYTSDNLYHDVFTLYY